MKDFTLEELKNAKPIFDKSVDRWLSPSYYHANGEVGGYLFETEQEAQKELNFLYNKVISKQEEAKRLVEQKLLNDSLEKSLIASYKGFLSNNPMKAGKQRATLEKTSWFPKVNRMVTKKEFVEIIANEGFTPNIRPKMKKVHGGYLEKDGDKTEYVLTKDGSSYVVNKTEWEYAEFLTGEKING